MKKQHTYIRNLFVCFWMVALVLASTACNNKADENPTETIAGSGSKTWKIDREENASGDKVKLSDSEKNETIVFYTNGTFSINSASMQEGGNWTYDPANKNLSMQFQGQTVSENFAVTELDKNEIKLRAADGSVMELEAE